jgi:nicotinamide mononucleotide (NMN) deamidase PncC
MNSEVPNFASLHEIALRIGKLLLARKESVAVTESACGVRYSNAAATYVALALIPHIPSLSSPPALCQGLISAALLSVPGASSFYQGANVAYSRAGQKAFFPVDLMQNVKNGTVAYGGDAFMLKRAHFVRLELQADWGVSETGQTGPTFLKVRAKGPYDAKEGPRTFENGQGQARGIVAVTNGETESSQLFTTELFDRPANMLLFASKALLLLERTLQQETGSAHL